MHLYLNEAKISNNHIKPLLINAGWNLAYNSSCEVLAKIKWIFIRRKSHVGKLQLYQYLRKIEANKHLLGLVFIDIRNFKLHHG